MDDTQSSSQDDPSALSDAGSEDPVAALADMDPAEAPTAAERYAATLESDLEAAGASSSEPVQLRADLGAGNEP
jgi:hypothetical protein